MRLLLLCDDGDPQKVVPLCQRFQCGIEIQAFYNPLLLDNDPSAVDKHLSLLAGIALRSSHGCFGDLCPGSGDPLVRSVARNRFDLSYSVARRLGANHLVLHLGYVPNTSPPRYWLPRCIEFWQAFLADKDDPISFHVENVLEWEPDMLADLIDAVARPSLDVNLDIGHVHCNARTDLQGWIHRLGTRIGYVHIHDNHGKEDEHLALGAGTIAMEEVLSLLQTESPDAIWALETQVDALEGSMKWLEDKGMLEARTYG
jgi:sugar phosphate isomerase/epimerase